MKTVPRGLGQNTDDLNTRQTTSNSGTKFVSGHYTITPHTHSRTHTLSTLNKQRVEHAGTFNVHLGSSLVMHLETR